jgi:hypothetical protein
MKSRTMQTTLLAVIAGFAMILSAPAQALLPVQDHP